MPNDRLWLHWLVLLVAGGAAILAAVFTPDIGWLRLGLGIFGAVLVVIGVAGALDIGWGTRGGETGTPEGAAKREEAGRDGGAGAGDREPEEEPPPPSDDPEAERLRKVGEKVRRGEGEGEGDASAGDAGEGPNRSDGDRGTEEGPDSPEPEGDEDEGRSG